MYGDVVGVTPTEATYGSLMQACIRADDMPAAYKVLAIAEDSGLKLGSCSAICLDRSRSMFIVSSPPDLYACRPSFVYSVDRWLG